MLTFIITTIIIIALLCALNFAFSYAWNIAGGGGCVSWSVSLFYLLCSHSSFKFWFIYHLLKIYFLAHFNYVHSLDFLS